MDASIKQKLVAVSDHTQTGAIVRHVFNLDRENQFPRYVGQGITTSDGFVMCDFVDSHGEYHFGAFVGALSDLENNTIRLAKYCNLSAEQRAELYAAVLEWAGKPFPHLSDAEYAASEKAAARKRDAKEGFDE